MVVGARTVVVPMAGAYLTALCEGVDVRTAGAERADEADPVVVLVMAEKGIHLRAVRPGALSAADVLASDVVTTVGARTSAPTPKAGGIRAWSSRARSARTSSACAPFVR